MISKIFKPLKEKIVSAVAGKIVKGIGKRYLDGIGTIESFKLDTTAKSIAIRLNLEGENNRLFSLSVEKYELIHQADATFLKIIQCSSSDRPWMNTIMQNYVEGHQFEIPAKFVGAVNFLV